MEGCRLETEMGRELSWWLLFGSGAFVCRVPEIADMIRSYLRRSYLYRAKLLRAQYAEGGFVVRVVELKLAATIHQLFVLGRCALNPINILL